MIRSGGPIQAQWRSMNPHVDPPPALPATDVGGLGARDGRTTSWQRSPDDPSEPDETSFCGSSASKPLGEFEPVTLRNFIMLDHCRGDGAAPVHAQSASAAHDPDGDMVEGSSAGALPNTPLPQTRPEWDRAYAPPSHQMLFRIYMFDGMGPYPIFGAIGSAAFNQASNSPPEWGQGLQGYTERFLSIMGSRCREPLRATFWTKRSGKTRSITRATAPA